MKIAAHLERANELRLEIEARHAELATEIAGARNAGATLAQCAEGAGVTVSELRSLIQVGNRSKARQISRSVLGFERVRR